MRILYVTQYFPPETGAGATRAYEMASAWAAAGHDVHVVCPFPNYPEGKVHPPYQGKLFSTERMGRLAILRVPIFAAERKTLLNRLANYGSFAATGALGSIFRRKADVIYVSSPPLPVGLAGLMGKLKGAKFFFEVRDLWPESARAVGELTHPVAYAAAERFARYCYTSAHTIVVVTQGIRERLIRGGIPAHKIYLAPNGVNLSRFSERPPVPIQEDKPQHLQLFYGGLLGLAQGIPSLLEAVRLLKRNPHIRLVVAGSGPLLPMLARAQANEKLEHLILLGNVPPTEIPAHIQQADACVVPLGKDPLFHSALPSKMFEAWACARPVLLSASGEAARLVARSQAGIIVPPEDPGSLAEAASWMALNRPALQEMGRRGLDLVKQYDRVHIAQELLSVMEQAR